MMRPKKNELTAVFLSLCSIIPGAAVYGRLPARIATNWGIDGTPNSFSPKAFVVFVMPLIYTATVLLCCLYVRRLEAKDRAGKLGDIIPVMFPVLFLSLHGMILLAALGKLTDIPTAACLLSSAMMIVLGNYMPKVRKNWIIGIRTPHIIADEEVWHKTHRLAGVTLTLGGAAGTVISLFSHPLVTLAVIMIAVFIPLIYGEALYFRSKGRKDS